jgi:hypothetical protein
LVINRFVPLTMKSPPSRRAIGDVLLTLSIARLYGHHAHFSGTARQAVADGYSAVDAAFTALLRNAGLKQPRNHKHKLDLVRETFPNVFDAVTIENGSAVTHIPGTDWDSLEAFYREWLASRYERFEMGAAVSSSRVREALNVVGAAIRYIAADTGISSEELEARVSTHAYGFDFSEVSASVGDAHERLFAEAEAVGDVHGSRLGMKMAATTNYCDLDVMAGDSLTRAIIRDDKAIAEEAARIYHAFVGLIEQIQAKRLDAISGGKPHDKCNVAEINQSPDFMLSMKARYHGGTTVEMGARWFGRITSALAKSLKKLVGG